MKIMIMIIIIMIIMIIVSRDPGGSSTRRPTRRSGSSRRSSARRAGARGRGRLVQVLSVGVISITSVTSVINVISVISVAIVICFHPRSPRARCASERASPRETGRSRAQALFHLDSVGPFRAETSGRPETGERVP